MRHSGSFRPESIANEQSAIQIVDTQKSLETRVSIGFAARWHRMNRTLLIKLKTRETPPWGWRAPLAVVGLWWDFGLK
jgi:hypothetical protein